MKNYKSFAMITSLILVVSLTSCVKDPDVPTTPKKYSIGTKVGEVETIYEVLADTNFPDALVRYTYIGTDGEIRSTAQRGGFKTTAYIPVIQEDSAKRNAAFWLKCESVDTSVHGLALKLSMRISVTDKSKGHTLKWGAQYGKPTSDGTDCGKQEREVSGKFSR